MDAKAKRLLQDVINDRTSSAMTVGDVSAALLQLPFMQDKVGIEKTLRAAHLGHVVQVIDLNGLICSVMPNLVIHLLRTNDLRAFVQAALDVETLREQDAQEQTRKIIPTRDSVAQVVARMKVDPNFAAELAQVIGEQQREYRVTLQNTNRTLVNEKLAAQSNSALKTAELEKMYAELSTMVSNLGNAWWRNE